MLRDFKIIVNTPIAVGSFIIGGFCALVAYYLCIETARDYSALLSYHLDLNNLSSAFCAGPPLSNGDGN